VQRATAARGVQSVHCTRNPRQFDVQAVSTKVFICIARTGKRCDRYIAVRRGTHYDVRLQLRNVDCIVPA
jgi:hypothetical protein